MFVRSLISEAAYIGSLFMLKEKNTPHGMSSCEVPPPGHFYLVLPDFNPDPSETRSPLGLFRSSYARGLRYSMANIS